ncbi:amidohydrolase family protein [Mesorhizobium amorphae]|uniref:amidohydrolase family protein n=1 Tax=Mesorhizobium amorphae TaxID=71433 RepID=UPI00177A96C3|nr:amidohydrolase family protein [Mesorhizobium amorphae]
MNAERPGIRTEPRLCLPPLAPVRRDANRLPPGTCDTHAHVFGPVARFPLDPGRGYTPSPVTIIDYRRVMDAFGIERAVLVQPSVYGFENSVLFEALETMPDRLRGVAVISPKAPETLFAWAHRLGVRGLRINPRNPAGLTMKDFHAVAECIKPFGWHIQLQVDIEDSADLGHVVAAAGVPVIIDHFGFPDLARGPDGRAFAELVELAAAGQCIVKMSAPYRVAPDRYAALKPFVERLVDRAPAALIWALDWPHTECFEAVPDDGAILDLVWDWLPSEELRRQVLVDTPRNLFWADGEPASTKASGSKA